MSILEEDPRFHRTAVLLIILVGLIIYSNSISSSFHFDDYKTIVFNPFMKKLGNIPLFFQENHVTSASRGIPTASFAINYYFSGLAVEGYHWTNISIHLLNGILVYFLVGLLLRQFLSDEALASESKVAVLALFAGLFFVANPVQTHSVTYIVQRNGEMATFFYLFSLVLFIRAVSWDKVRIRYYLGSLLCFLCGLWCKEIAYTALATLFLYYLFFIAKYRMEWSSVSRGLKILLPYAALAAVSLHLQHVVEGRLQPLIVEKGLYPTSEGYLLTMSNVIIEYIKLLLLPLPSRLNADIDFPTAKTLWEWPTAFSVATIALLLGSAVFLLKRNRLLAFGILWFFITLSPDGILLAVDEVMVCYRLYLPGFAFYLLLVIFIHRGFQYLVKRLKQERFTSRAWAAEITVFILVLFSYCIGTYESNKVWKDEITLWEDTVKKSPAKARPHCSLGEAYYKKGLDDLAIRQFKEAIKLNPNYAEAHNNLGCTYGKKGLYDLAIRQFEEAIRLSPDLAEAHLGLGKAYYNKGRNDLAIRQYEEAIRLNPDYAEAHYNLGVAYAQKGLYGLAIGRIEQAVRIKPDLEKAHNLLDELYRARGR